MVDLKHKPWSQEDQKQHHSLTPKAEAALLELFDYFYDRKAFAKIIERTPTLEDYDNDLKLYSIKDGRGYGRIAKYNRSIDGRLITEYFSSRGKRQ